MKGVVAITWESPSRSGLVVYSLVNPDMGTKRLSLM
jgi:hypothetical protein